MAKRKKAATVDVELRMPVPVLAFYEGVAAYTGLTVSDVINVALVLEMCKRNAPPQSERRND